MTTAIYNKTEWIGKRFGMLTVLEAVKYGENTRRVQWRWRVKCDCGNEKVMSPRDLITGKSVSCGCYKKSGKQVQIIHGESHTHLHNVWCGMNNRCNPNHANTRGYGERGIIVCEEWKDYAKFAEWARTNGYEEGLTIERIDVNGNYCPENCCWIPHGEQARNRRTTKWVEWQGRKMSLAEAAEIAGLPYKQVHFRLKHGWDLEKALTTPLKHGASDLKMEAEKNGINYHTAYNRYYIQGWSFEDATSIPSAGKGANQTTYKKK